MLTTIRVRPARPLPLGPTTADFSPTLVSMFAVTIWLGSAVIGRADNLLATATVDAVELRGPEVNWLDEDEWLLDIGESEIVLEDVTDAQVIVAPVPVRGTSERFAVSAELLVAGSIDRGKLRMTFADGAEHTFDLTPGPSLGLRLSVDGPISFLPSDSGNRMEVVYTELGGIEASEFRFLEFETDVQNRSFELNWRVDEADDNGAVGFESMILGLRYVQHKELVSETIDYSAVWPGLTDTYSQRWLNDLFGVQIGFGDSLKMNRGTLSVNIKMGAYYNSVTQSLPITPARISAPAPFTSKDGHFSLGQQYEVRWNQPVSESASFGYGLFYLRYSEISQAGNAYQGPGDPSELQYFGGLFSLRLKF